MTKTGLSVSVALLAIAFGRGWGAEPPADEKLTAVTVVGKTGFIGDGGPATAGRLTAPEGIALVGRDLYIADSASKRVRRVDGTTSTISTVAGTGLTGYNGDGIPATTALLGGTRGVTFDAAGNYYIIDISNQRIRMVNPAGVISTAVGSGVLGFTDDGLPAAVTAIAFPESIVPDAAGNLYYTDSGNARVRRIDAVTHLVTTVAGTGKLGIVLGGFGGDNGPASAAVLNGPQGVTLDAAGNLYVVDGANGRIRFVNLGSQAVTLFPDSASPLTVPPGYINTVATTGGGGLGVAVDGSRNIYFTAGNRVRRVDAGTGAITTVAGVDSGSGGLADGIPATAAALLGTSYGLVLDGARNLYFSEPGTNKVRFVNRTDQPVTLYSGAAAITVAPGAIATAAGGFLPPANDGGPAIDANLSSPGWLAFDGAGNLFICDAGTHTVRRVDATRDEITTVAGTGVAGPDDDLPKPAATATLNSPNGIVFDEAGNLILADTANNRLRVISPAGTLSTLAGGGAVFADGGSPRATTLAAPRGPTLRGPGELYFADSGTNRIRFINLTDHPVTVFGSIAVAPGTIATVAGGGTSAGENVPALQVALNGPRAVVLDGDGNLYIPETGARRIRRIAADTGLVTTAVGSGLFQQTGDGVASGFSFNSLRQLALDARGNLWATDGGNGRLLEVFPPFDNSGWVRNVAGITPLGGFNGDGLSSTATLLNGPSGVAFDLAGNIYIGDSNNSRVRRLNLATRGVSVQLDGTAAGSVSARVELYAGQTHGALGQVTLRTVDATGQPTSNAFAGTAAGGGYAFGANGTLHAGQAFRVEGRLADGRTLSGDTGYAITWAGPAALRSGTPLSATQLSAAASVPGTFVYSPPAGTVLAPGFDQPLAATFTPADPAKGPPGTASVTVTVGLTRASLAFEGLNLCATLGTTALGRFSAATALGREVQRAALALSACEAGLLMGLGNPTAARTVMGFVAQRAPTWMKPSAEATAIVARAVRFITVPIVP